MTAARALRAYYRLAVVFGLCVMWANVVDSWLALFPSMLAGVFGIATGWCLRTWFDISEWADPIGWDEHHQRVHDLTPRPGGGMLHHSTCWCRTEADHG